MNTRALMLAALALLFASPSWADDLQALQGVWHIESAESGGNRIDLGARGDMRIYIRQQMWTAVYPAPAGQNPQQFTFQIALSEGHSPKRYTQTDIKTGEVMERGIYRLEGDTLMICFSPVDIENYPTKFQSHPAHMLVVLKKIP
jgi:uncharacterized protein (TIGR03067 family)